MIIPVPKKYMFTARIGVYSVAIILFLSSGPKRADFVENFSEAYRLSWHKISTGWQRQKNMRDAKIYLSAGNRILRKSSRKHFGKAIKNYEAAIKLIPDMEEAYLGLGAIYTRKDHHVKATEMFEKVIAINPNNAQAYNDLGVSCLMLQEVDRAIEQFEHFLKLHPPTANVYRNLGHAYIEKKDFQRSLDYFKKSVELDGEIKEAYYRIGICHLALGNKEEALRQVHILKERFPRSALSRKLSKRITGKD